MRYLLTSLMVLMLCCAPKNLTVEIPEAPSTDMSGVMALFGLEAIGHACPVGEFVYTAKHNVYDTRKTSNEQEERGFSWEDGFGNKGIAKSIIWNNFYDLAILQVEGDSPSYYAKGEEPTSGDEVRWVDYKRNQHEMFKPDIRKAKVIHSLAGYIFVDAAPIPGSSGSCLIDSQGKAVGVIVWGLYGLAGVAVELP